MITFWILWVFNALFALIPIYFFFIGLADGSISSRNLGLWFIILLIVGLITGGTLYLKSHNQLALAKTTLILSAIPCILVILYFVVAFTSKGRWN